MLHKDIDTLIKDLTTASMTDTVEAIATQFDTDYLHQVTLKIQSLLKAERKKLKPMEDELVEKSHGSETRHNLRVQLIKKLTDSADSQSDDEKDTLKDSLNYQAAGKYFSKLKWLQIQLIEVMNDKINGNREYRSERRSPINALFSAMEKKRVDDVLLLLNNGVDINFSSEDQRTLLHFAVLHGNETAVNYLLGKGLKTDAKTKNGNTPLHFAESVEIANLLLKNNAAIDALNYENETPLIATLKRKDVAIARKLVESGANANGKDSSGNPLFHYAVETGDKDLISLLISKGSKINAKDGEGYTALHHSVGKPEIVRQLIDLGADITAKNHKGETPLFTSVGYSDNEVFKMLCTADTLKTKNLDGASILNKCVMRKKLDNVQYLIETAGVDINICDNHGKSPLYNAMIEYIKLYDNEFLPMIQYLISKGADVNAKNNDGKSPLDILKEAEKSLDDIMPKPAVADSTTTVADAIKLSGGSPVFSGSTPESKDNNSTLRASRSSSGSDSSDSDDDFRRTSQP